MMNHTNQDQSKNNGRTESKATEPMSQKRSSEKESQEQGEVMARGFMRGRAFRTLCAVGAMVMIYRMGRRVLARRRAER
jgi:hypothetical protein